MKTKSIKEALSEKAFPKYPYRNRFSDKLKDEDVKELQEDKIIFNEFVEKLKEEIYFEHNSQNERICKIIDKLSKEVLGVEEMKKDKNVLFKGNLVDLKKHKKDCNEYDCHLCKLCDEMEKDIYELLQKLRGKRMKDLFPNKRFNYTKINGVEYISKDILEMLINQAKQEMRKECIKIIDKGLIELANKLHPSNQDYDWYKIIYKHLKQKLSEVKK